MENFINQEITTGFFFSSIFGIGLVGFFIFLIFWVTNSSAKFEIK